MSVALARHDALMRAALEQRGGSILNTKGDEFRIAFFNTTDAIAAALEAAGKCTNDAGACAASRS